jgi:hypothetical protein
MFVYLWCLRFRSQFVLASASDVYEIAKDGKCKCIIKCFKMVVIDMNTVFAESCYTVIWVLIFLNLIFLG